MKVVSQAATLLFASQHQSLTGMLQLQREPLQPLGQLQGMDRRRGLLRQRLQQRAIGSTPGLYGLARRHEELANGLPLV